MLSRLFAATLSLLFAACAPTPGPKQDALLHLMADRDMSCKPGKECEALWNRAIEWMSKNSDEGVRTVSENLLEANMVSSGGHHALRYPEFSVIRYLKDGGYVMEFHSYCEQAFRCTTSALQWRASFVILCSGCLKASRKQGPIAIPSETAPIKTP